VRVLGKRMRGKGGWERGGKKRRGVGGKGRRVGEGGGSGGVKEG